MGEEIYKYKRHTLYYDEVSNSYIIREEYGNYPTTYLPHLYLDVKSLFALESLFKDYPFIPQGNEAGGYKLRKNGSVVGIYHQWGGLYSFNVLDTEGFWQLLKQAKFHHENK